LFARLAKYEVSPDQVDDAIEAFREAARGLAELDGNEGGYLLVDREDGAMMTFTFWTSQAAVAASEVRAAALRRQALNSVDGGVVGVDAYEVALEFGSVGNAPATS
jgi:heme-degrading monooxygenase HmoA